jgi:integrase
MANIQKRGGNTWFFTVYLGKGPDNKYIRKTKTVEVTEELTPKNLKEHLEYEYAKFRIEVETGSYITPGKKSFSEFKVMWAENYAKSSLSPTTLEAYNGIIEDRLIPAFGHLRLDQIKTSHILAFLKELEKPGARKTPKIDKPLTEKQLAKSKEPLDFGTIGYIYRVLKNIFTQAVAWNLLPTNPMSGISKPTPDNDLKKIKQAKQKKNPQYYNEEEAQAVVDALYKECRKWRLLILGSLIGGFRRGELNGLEKPLVNFEDNSIGIENNIPLTKEGKAIEKDPKSLSSIRNVGMPEWYMTEMKLHFEEWEQEKDDLKDKWEGGDREFVFHNGTGAPYYYQHASKWWVRFCKRHNLRYIKFHGLRHSTGTLLIEDEDDSQVDTLLIAIQHRLGHSRLSTTSDIYVHVTKKVKMRTTGKFDKFARSNVVSFEDNKPVAPQLKLVK